MKRMMLVFVGVVIVLVGVSAEGALLGLNLEDNPDITFGFTNVGYDAGTDVFEASGIALTLDDGSSALTITDGTVTITADIDAAGTLGSGGTVTVGGTIASLSYASGTLLTGDLTQFGFATTGADVLEFVFDVTGGDAADLYTAGEAPTGIILSFGGFSGSFEEDFDSSFGVGDIAPTPEPATLALLALGSAVMFRRRRR